jgi:hypothetical protein
MLAMPSRNSTATIGKAVRLKFVRTALPDLPAAEASVLAAVSAEASALVEALAEEAGMLDAEDLEVGLAAVAVDMVVGLAVLLHTMPSPPPLPTPSPTMRLPAATDARRSTFVT